MSLQVWLPLTKDLRQQGLASVTYTGTPVFKNIGKLSGKSLDLNTRISFNCSALANKTVFSIAFWAKVNSDTNLTSNWVDVIGLTDISSGGTNGQLRWETCYASGYESRGISGHDNGTYAITQYGATSGTTPVTVKNTWEHRVFTVSATQCTEYVDGVQRATYGVNGGHLSGAFWLGETNKINGEIQDVRIYDHCLSQMEVKELSKGLILHYPLSDYNIGNTKLWSLDSYTKSASLTTSNTYIYSIPTKTVYLTPGKQYTVGAEVRVNQDNILFYFDSNCTDENGVYSGNDAAQTVNYNPSITLTKNEWIPVWITTTIKADAGKPYYHHGFLFRTSSGTITTNCEIRNIQVYEGAEKLPIRPFNNTMVYDCSGFCNNGSPMTTTMTVSSDTSKYIYSTHFNAIDDGILIENLQLSDMINSAITYAFWIKPEGESGARSIYFGSYSGTSWSIEKTTGNVIRLYWMGSPDEVCSGATVTDGVWQHVCITKNGTNDVKVYINGIQKWSSTTAHNALTFSTTYRIGRDVRSNDGTPYKGLMSDVRIYATALSADDVKSLYQNCATIDPDGTIRGQIRN